MAQNWRNWDKSGTVEAKALTVCHVYLDNKRDIAHILSYFFTYLAQNLRNQEMHISVSCTHWVTVYAKYEVNKSGIIEDRILKLCMNHL